MLNCIYALWLPPLLPTLLQPLPLLCPLQLAVCCLLPLAFCLLGDTAEFYIAPIMAHVSQAIPKMRPRFAGGRQQHNQSYPSPTAFRPASHGPIQPDTVQSHRNRARSMPLGAQQPGHGLIYSSWEGGFWTAPMYVLHPQQRCVGVCSACLQ